MATGQGGYYTHGLTIATATNLPSTGLVPVDTQAPNGSAPQTLAATVDQVAAGSFQTLAAVGATQGTAAQITARRVFVTVTASTEGVKLPIIVVGDEHIVVAPSTVGVKVYPGANQRFSGVATNTAVVVASAKGNIYEAINANTWRVIKGA